MNRFRADMKSIQELVGKTYTKTGSLLALADGGLMSEKQLQRTLEQTAEGIEEAALRLRLLCERNMPGVGGYGSKAETSEKAVSAHAELTDRGWLHLTVNTLLPHCRYRPPTWLSQNLRRSLDRLAQTQELPRYASALLVIEEHSDVDGRHIFDQDNKGWKAVSNALKGRVIPDDDQYHLSVSLLSVLSPEYVCHIYLLPMKDAALYFAGVQQQPTDLKAE